MSPIKSKKHLKEKPQKIHYNHHVESSSINAVITLEGEELSYVQINFLKNFKRRALVDTGATTSSLSESVLLELQKNSVINKSSYCEPKFSQVKTASGQVINIDKQISVDFHIGDYKFTEDFLVLPKINNIIIGNSFFIKNNVQICPRQNTQV